MQNRVQFKNRLATKIMTGTIIFSILLAAVMYMGMYKISQSTLVDALGQTSSSIAKHVSENIDKEQFEELLKSGDMASAYYNALGESLREVQNISGAKYLYLIQRDGSGQISFIIEADDFGTEDATEFGYIPDEVYEGYEIALDGRGYIEEEMTIDEYGYLLSSYEPILDKQGKVIAAVGVDYDVEAEYKGFLDNQRVIGIAGLGAFLILTLFGWVIARSVTKPMLKLTTTMARVAAYDLTNDPIEVTSSSEIGLMTKNWNTMTENLLSLIKQSKFHSQEIYASGEEVTAEVATVNEVSMSISAQMEKVNSATESQMLSVNNSVALSDNLTQKVNQVADYMEQSAEDIDRMRRAADEGVASLRTLSMNLGMDDSFKKEIWSDVKTLSERSNDIEGVVEIIQGIAKQTNLLALNAAIEAARAGEHGKGFSVVADEVRKLSEESGNATEDIKKMIMDMTAIVSKTKDSINASQENTEKVNTGIGEMTSSFNNLKTDIDSVVERFKGISTSMKDIAEAKDVMVEAISTIDTASVENIMSVQEVCEAINKLNKAIAEITDSMEAVNKITEELSKEMDQFRVE